MEFTIADKYYVKALDEYPYNLEDSLENLNYALSSNPEHSGANFLMGRIYNEQMLNFEKAEQYFQMAIASDTDNSSMYLEYAEVLIHNLVFEKAEKLISYAEKLTSTDLSNVYRLRGLCSEYKKDFKTAIKWYRKACLEVCFDEKLSFLESQIKRVKSKKKLSQPKNVKKKK